MNAGIFVCAIVFFITENQYFGWNGSPKSDAELIADGIVVLLFALAFLGKS